MPRGKPKIPPAVAGMMGADGGGWNLIRRPKTPEDMERSAEIIKTLHASRNPEDQKALKSLTSLRQTVRQQQASIQMYMAAVASHPAFQEKMAEWAVENPGEFMKITAQMLPKDANLEITTTQERIVKVEYAKDWEARVKEVAQQTIDGEVVE